jgi:hypothetical protein
MGFHTCVALVLVLSACATPMPRARPPGARNPRIANLQRAAVLPWRDEGRCVVQQAVHPWPVVVERCFHALDTQRIRFRDAERRCPVASADAATLQTMVGICLLTQPELVVGAVVIIGVVVVAVAIVEALEAYELEGVRPEDLRPASETAPAPQPLAEPRPKPEPAGEDWFPPVPPEPPQRERPECAPQPVPHRGGDDLHDQCADRVPQNGFPGWDVLVNGKQFDALQLGTRVLWEIKTDNFDTYSAYLRRTVPEQQAVELRRERDLARACGFDFRVGVRSAAHKVALEFADPKLEGIIVVMDWC